MRQGGKRKEGDWKKRERERKKARAKLSMTK